MTENDGTIPKWAADLQVGVARIEGRTEQIPGIARGLEELRANTVPMAEHIKLLNDVEELKERDIGARSDWDDVKMRVLDPKGTLNVLWEDRISLRGSVRTMKWIVAGLGVVLTLLTIVVVLRDLGVSISVAKP